MKSYLRKLKAYVKANPTRFDDDCPLPALDSLYWHYTECHTMTNEKTKQASRNLSAYLRFLPPKKRDDIRAATHPRTAMASVWLWLGQSLPRRMDLFRQ